MSRDEKVELPPTDIEVEAISVVSCDFRDQLFSQVVVGGSPADPQLDQPTGVEVTPEISVWFSGDNKRAIVSLAVRVSPETQPSWVARVEVIGRYRSGENPIMPLKRFAWNNGVAYLVPYVRERLASLTAASDYQTYQLPPLSVAKLRELAAHPASADSA
ncbi:MAG: hypothetical protein R3B35_09075 [Gemmatimonadales bacterium]